MTSDPTRDEFEKWAADEPLDLSRLGAEYHYSEDYEDATTSAAWSAWQAATSRAAAADAVVEAARKFKQDRICVEGERNEEVDCWSGALVAINDALDAYDSTLAAPVRASLEPRVNPDVSERAVPRTAESDAHGALSAAPVRADYEPKCGDVTRYFGRGLWIHDGTGRCRPLEEPSMSFTSADAQGNVYVRPATPLELSQHGLAPSRAKDLEPSSIPVAEPARPAADGSDTSSQSRKAHEPDAMRVPGADGGSSTPAPAAPEFKCGTCKDTGSILGTRRVFNAVTEKAIDVCAGWERCPECTHRAVGDALAKAVAKPAPASTPRETPREAGRATRVRVTGFDNDSSRIKGAADDMTIGKEYDVVGWDQEFPRVYDDVEESHVLWGFKWEPVSPAPVEAPDVEGLIDEYGMFLCDVVTEDAGLGVYSTPDRTRLLSRAALRRASLLAAIRSLARGARP